MSKAEEYSFNIPSELFQQLTKEQQVLWRKEIENTFNNGYQQAERDLELTWGDMLLLADIEQDVFNHSDSPLKGVQAAYEEVLKRFKAQKVDIVMDESNTNKNC